MQKWEYITILRSRGWDEDKDNPKAPWQEAVNLDVDIMKKLEEFGEQGWELVTVTPRSSYLGSHKIMHMVDLMILQDLPAMSFGYLNVKNEFSISKI